MAESDVSASPSMAAGSGAAAASLLASGRKPPAPTGYGVIDDSDIAAADGVISDLRVWKAEQAQQLEQRTAAMEALLESGSAQLAAEPFVPALPKQRAPTDPSKIASLRHRFEGVKSDEALANISSSDARLRAARAHGATGKSKECASPHSATEILHSDVDALRALELAAARLAELGIDPSTLGDASGDDEEYDVDWSEAAVEASASTAPGEVAGAASITGPAPGKPVTASTATASGETRE